jgi:hypothetical protein
MKKRKNKGEKCKILKKSLVVLKIILNFAAENKI